MGVVRDERLSRIFGRRVAASPNPPTMRVAFADESNITDFAPASSAASTTRMCATKKLSDCTRRRTKLGRPR